MLLFTCKASAIEAAPAGPMLLLVRLILVMLLFTCKASAIEAAPSSPI